MPSASREEDVALPIVLLHCVEESVTIVLCVPLDKEVSCRSLTDAKLDQEEEHAQHHSVLVLSGAVVKDKGDVLEWFFGVDCCSGDTSVL